MKNKKILGYTLFFTGIFFFIFCILSTLYFFILPPIIGISTGISGEELLNSPLPTIWIITLLNMFVSGHLSILTFIGENIILEIEEEEKDDD